MNLEQIKTVKMVARFIVGRSVSAVIVTLVHQNVATTSRFQKLQLYIGAYVIGSMVSDQARIKTNHAVDKSLSFWTEVKENAKKST